MVPSPPSSTSGSDSFVSAVSEATTAARSSLGTLEEEHDESKENLRPAPDAKTPLKPDIATKTIANRLLRRSIHGSAIAASPVRPIITANATTRTASKLPYKKSTVGSATKRELPRFHARPPSNSPSQREDRFGATLSAAKAAFGSAIKPRVQAQVHGNVVAGQTSFIKRHENPPAPPPEELARYKKEEEDRKEAEREARRRQRLREEEQKKLEKQEKREQARLRARHMEEERKRDQAAKQAEKEEKARRAKEKVSVGVSVP